MRYSVFLFYLFCVLLAPQVRAAPAQQAFSDWQVTCNNQNFASHAIPVNTVVWS
jgi:hypothetical protein